MGVLGRGNNSAKGIEWHFAVTSNDDLRFKYGMDGYYAKSSISVSTQRVRHLFRFTLLGFAHLLMFGKYQLVESFGYPD